MHKRGPSRAGKKIIKILFFFYESVLESNYTHGKQNSPKRTFFSNIRSKFAIPKEWPPTSAVSEWRRQRLYYYLANLIVSNRMKVNLSREDNFGAIQPFKGQTAMRMAKMPRDDQKDWHFLALLQHKM